MFRRASAQSKTKDSGPSRSRPWNSDSNVDIGEQLQGWTQHAELIGQILLDRSCIVPDDLTAALAQQQDRPDVRIGKLLVEAGAVTEDELTSALAEQFGVPVSYVLEEKIEEEAIEAVTEAIATEHKVVPLRVVGGRVFVAIGDPLNTTVIKALTDQCSSVGVLLASESDIEEFLEKQFSALKEADVHIQAFELSHEEATTESLRAEVDANAPVVQVVNRIITQAVRNRASDIHIEPQEKDVRVRYRVDGALVEAIRLPIKMAPALSSRIKVLAELNIVERRKPQDGQFSMKIDGRPIDLRTSIIGTVLGEKAVLRILDKTRSLISLKELGMSNEMVESYTKIVSAPLGMLLCTGPTGSGKTTSLYATLNELNDDARNVITIEDPVEYQFPGISQMQVSENGGFTFAEGLRGTLRQDPDVILVGEIRDIETARIAMQAALTGHFVLSSLHSVDAVAAVHRFIDMGIEPFLIASAISGVVGQRLLRVTCTSCKAPYEPAPEHRRILSSMLGNADGTFYKGRGCSVCSNSGYRGRIGVYELLRVTDSIRDLIVDKATHHEILEVAISEGLETMQHQAFKLARDGVTSVEEVIRAVYSTSVGASEAPPLLALPAPKIEIGSGAKPLSDTSDGSDTTDTSDGSDTSNASVASENSTGSDEAGKKDSSSSGDASADTSLPKFDAPIPAPSAPTKNGSSAKDKTPEAPTPPKIPKLDVEPKAPQKPESVVVPDSKQEPKSNGVGESKPLPKESKPFPSETKPLSSTQSPRDSRSGEADRGSGRNGLKPSESASSLTKGSK